MAMLANVDDVTITIYPMVEDPIVTGFGNDDNWVAEETPLAVTNDVAASSNSRARSCRLRESRALPCQGTVRRH